MGVWGPGVFENDGTADFAVEFDQAEPARRAGRLPHPSPLTWCRSR